MCDTAMIMLNSQNLTKSVDLNTRLHEEAINFTGITFSQHNFSTQLRRVPPIPFT